MPQRKETDSTGKWVRHHLFDQRPKVFSYSGYENLKAKALYLGLINSLPSESFSLNTRHKPTTRLYTVHGSVPMLHMQTDSPQISNLPNQFYTVLRYPYWLKEKVTMKHTAHMNGSACLTHNHGFHPIGSVWWKE